MLCRKKDNLMFGSRAMAIVAHKVFEILAFAITFAVRKCG